MTTTAMPTFATGPQDCIVARDAAAHATGKPTLRKYGPDFTDSLMREMRVSALHVPSATAMPVRYDAPAFRRQVGLAGTKVTPLFDPGQFDTAWSAEPAHVWRSNSSRCDPYVDSDLSLDPVALEYAATIGEWIEVLRGGNLNTPVRETLASRLRYIRSVHTYGYMIGRGQLASGGLPHVAGRLTPDPTIECVYERSFLFAATAIAHGADDLLARTFAAAVIVTHGLPRPLIRTDHWPEKAAGRRLHPRHTVLATFYTQAIKDLRQRHDATRFMQLVARSL